MSEGKLTNGEMKVIKNRAHTIAELLTIEGVPNDIVSYIALIFLGLNKYSLVFGKKATKEMIIEWLDNMEKDESII